ncbi:hypothetical protein ABFB09_09195 [Dehalogenimonas sp. THU2]|uniref:hypothetical protein n=1 Tax=Dehalogenimonas sp. THU2 TaxID=3151121 RepID=UPI00321824F0
MASIWDSSGSKVIKTQTTIDPGLLKAAEQAKNNTSGSTTTAGTTTEMGAARLADKNGGKPSDYLGLTAAQLADKLGGKPSDYKLYVPADTYIPPASAVTPPSGTSAALDPGLLKAAEEQAKKASSPPPGQSDITVSEAKTPEPAGTKPPPEPVKATDLDSSAPVSSIKVAPEGMSTTAALSLGMMPAETAKNLGVEGGSVSVETIKQNNQVSADAAKQIQIAINQSKARELADITGLKPTQILKDDGSVNSLSVADALGGKPSDYKTIDDVLEASTLQDSGAIKDRVKEILTFGQATTKTFNQDDLVKEYQANAAEASKAGLVMVESQQEYVTRVLNSQAKTGEVVGDFALGMVPIVGTIAFWDKMDTGGKVFSAGLDLLTFIPLAGIAGAAVRAGKSTAKGVTEALIAEARAPLTTITRPIDTAKSVLYPIETMVKPSKIPLSALEVQESTVRLGVATDLKVTPKAAMELRDDITMAQISGKTPKATAPSGTQVALTNKAINTTIAPAVVHSTPDIRPFLNGIEIIPGLEGKGLFVAPTLHTRFTRSSAFGLVGGEKAVPGALIITDPKILKQLKPSGKVYKGTVEIEMTLPAGVKLPPPSQMMMTRAADGTKLVMPVFGPKLTAQQISKMKIVGAADTVRDIFRPAKSVKGGKAASKAYDELLENNALLKQAKADLKALKKQGQTTTPTAKQLVKDIKRMDAERIRLERAARISNTGATARVGLRYAARTMQEEVRDATRTARAGESTRASTRPARSGADTARGRTSTRGGNRAVFGGGVARGRTDNDRGRGKTGNRSGVDDSRRVPGDNRPPTPPDRRPPDDNRPPPPPPPVPPPPPPVPPPRKGDKRISTKGDNGSDEPRIKMGIGDVAWRQGLWWIVKRKNGETIYTRRPPEGAKRFDGTPKETFFTRGDKPPQELEHEMGVTEAKIDLTKQPKIEFIENKPPKVVKQTMPRNIRRQLGMR